MKLNLKYNSIYIATNILSYRLIRVLNTIKQNLKSKINKRGKGERKTPFDLEGISHHNHHTMLPSFWLDLIERKIKKLPRFHHLCLI